MTASQYIGIDIRKDGVSAALIKKGEPIKTTYIPVEGKSKQETLAAVRKAASECGGGTVKAAAFVIPERETIPKTYTTDIITEKELILNFPFEFKDFIAAGQEEDYMFDYRVTDHEVNEKGALKSITICAAAIKKEIIENYREMFKSIGLVMERAIPESTAYSNIINKYTDEDGKEDISEIGFINIGKKRSSLFMFVNGACESKREMDKGCETRYTGDETESLALQDLATDIMRSLNNYKLNHTGTKADTLYIHGPGAGNETLIDSIKELTGFNVVNIKTLTKGIVPGSDTNALAIAAGY